MSLHKGNSVKSNGNSVNSGVNHEESDETPGQQGRKSTSDVDRTSTLDRSTSSTLDRTSTVRTSTVRKSGIHVNKSLQKGGKNKKRPSRSMSNGLNNLTDEDLSLTVADSLKKAANERTEEDLNYVIHLLKKVKIFSSMARDELEGLAINCSIEKMSANEVIFRRGMDGDKFYLVLIGFVGIYMVGGKYVSDNGSFELSNMSPKQLLGQFLSYYPQFSRIKQTIAHQIQEYGNLIKVIQPCEYFGELALLGDAKRSAGAVCVTNCELLTIQRQVFANAVEVSYREERKVKEMFLENTILNSEKLLFSLTRADIVRMAYMLQMESYPKGHVFVEAGANSGDLVWFIHRGQAALIDDKKEIVSIIGEGQMIGAFHVLFKKPEPYRIVAYSGTMELMAIAVRNFALHLPPSATAHLREKFDLRRNWYQLRDSLSSNNWAKTRQHIDTHERKVEKRRDKINKQRKLSDSPFLKHKERLLPQLNIESYQPIDNGSVQTGICTQPAMFGQFHKGQKFDPTDLVSSGGGPMISDKRITINKVSSDYSDRGSDSKKSPRNNSSPDDAPPPDNIISSPNNTKKKTDKLEKNESSYNNTKDSQAERHKVVQKLAYIETHMIRSGVQIDEKQRQAQHLNKYGSKSDKAGSSKSDSKFPPTSGNYVKTLEDLEHERIEQEKKDRIEIVKKKAKRPITTTSDIDSWIQLQNDQMAKLLTDQEITTMRNTITEDMQEDTQEFLMKKYLPGPKRNGVEDYTSPKFKGPLLDTYKELNDRYGLANNESQRLYMAKTLRNNELNQKPIILQNGGGIIQNGGGIIQQTPINNSSGVTQMGNQKPINCNQKTNSIGSTTTGSNNKDVIVFGGSNEGGHDASIGSHDASIGSHDAVPNDVVFRTIGSDKNDMKGTTQRHWKLDADVPILSKKLMKLAKASKTKDRNIWQSDLPIGIAKKAMLAREAQKHKQRISPIEKKEPSVSHNLANSDIFSILRDNKLTVMRIR